MIKPIAIFGVPRSGTSWLGQLFNSSERVAYRYQPLFSYAFKGRLNENSTLDEINAFHLDLIASKDEFVLQSKNISGKSAPQFSKQIPTHLIWKEVRYLHIIENLIRNSDTKVIGIIRHPCAVLNSWHKAPKEFNPDWNFREQWKTGDLKNLNRKEEFYGFDKWSEAVIEFTRLQNIYPKQFFIVKYEELVQDTSNVLVSLFEFIGLEFTPQVQDFIHESTANDDGDPYGVHRIKSDLQSWKLELDAEIQDQVIRLCRNNNTIANLGYFQ